MKKRMSGKFAIFLLAMGLAGCSQTQNGETEKETVVLSDGKNSAAETEGNFGYAVGQGFRPPKGSKLDKKGNIVDPEGNTFDKNGGWQVPEGGRVDSKGRIYDKNGKMMGGGAVVGSKG